MCKTKTKLGGVAEGAGTADAGVSRCPPPKCLARCTVNPALALSLDWSDRVTR